jgi:hypothetical protein
VPDPLVEPADPGLAVSLWSLVVVPAGLPLFTELSLFVLWADAVLNAKAQTAVAVKIAIFFITRFFRNGARFIPREKNLSKKKKTGSFFAVFTGNGRLYPAPCPPYLALALMWFYRIERYRLLLHLSAY